MSVIKLFAAGLVGTLSSVSIDIPADGVIQTLTLGATIESDAVFVDGEGVTAELSFLSSPTFTTNDVRGSLCQVRANRSGGGAAAAWAASVAVPFCILSGIDVPVNAGERVFLHLQGVAGIASSSAVAYLFVKDGIDITSGRTPRRR